MFNVKVKLSDSVSFFFFQAEDGIRDLTVTGVQTCALPICLGRPRAVDLAAAAAPGRAPGERSDHACIDRARRGLSLGCLLQLQSARDPEPRSEERRVGKECRSRWSPYH